MDTFASLALATESPPPTLLDRKPHNRNEFMVSKVVLNQFFSLFSWFLYNVDNAETYYRTSCLPVYYNLVFAILWRSFLA